MRTQSCYVAGAHDLILAVSGFYSQRAVAFKSTRDADEVFVTQRHANHSAKCKRRVCAPLADGVFAAAIAVEHFVAFTSAFNKLVDQNIAIDITTGH